MHVLLFAFIMQRSEAPGFSCHQITELVLVTPSPLPKVFVAGDATKDKASSRVRERELECCCHLLRQSPRPVSLSRALSRTRPPTCTQGTNSKPGDKGRCLLQDDCLDLPTPSSSGDSWSSSISVSPVPVDTGVCKFSVLFAIGFNCSHTMPGAHNCS